MQFERFRQTQTSDYEIKNVVKSDYEMDIVKDSSYDMATVTGAVSSYTTMFFQKSIEDQNREKEENFKKRLEEFKTINTKEEARELAKKIMPIHSERVVFRIGAGKCIIINKEKVFRITFKTQKEFISFNFQ